MELIRRIPRPRGTTHLAYTYNQTNSKEDKRRLINHIIKAFINNEFFEAIIGTITSPPKNTKRNQGKKNQENNERVHISTELIRLSSLASFLCINETKLEQRIMKFLANQTKKNNSGDYDQNSVMESLARAQISGLLFGALNKGLKLTEWSTELQSVARLQGYHPLHIKEANSALMNDLTGQKHIMEVLKMVLGQGTKPNTTSIQILNQNGTGQAQEPKLTPTMAVALIEQKGLNLIPDTNTKALELLAHEHQVWDTPDVQAIPSDAQGVMSAGILDLAFTKHDDTSYIKHEERRTQEFGTEEVE